MFSVHGNCFLCGVARFYTIMLSLVDCAIVYLFIYFYLFINLFYLFYLFIYLLIGCFIVYRKVTCSALTSVVFTRFRS